MRYLLRKAGIRQPSAPIPQAIEGFGDATDSAKVTIVIPTRDKGELLEKCISSIFEVTAYGNYEVLIVNNQTRDSKTLNYLELAKTAGIRVLDFEAKFNFSKICNFAVKNSDSELICFLNNDTRVLSPDWLTSMVRVAQSSSAGVVGCGLIYPNGKIQNYGILFGLQGLAGPYLNGVLVGSKNAQSLNGQVLEVSAITFACALVSKNAYLENQGLDENFRVGLNDVDFGLRLQHNGYKNYVLAGPWVEHIEFASRNRMHTVAGAFQALREVLCFIKKHPGFKF
jgi:GT2 family glycosyltransferase